MTSPQMMWWTLGALLPGYLAAAWQFGWGVTVNLAAGALLAALWEALALRVRGQPLAALRDGSALVTGALLGLALPPLLPLWMLAVGAFLAIVFGKQVYGGLGRNIFNPAMVGYAALILAFPLAMSQWPVPDSSVSQASLDQIAAKFELTAGRPAFDGVTGATPLDAFKFQQVEAGREAWMLVNGGFLAGGLVLLALRIVPWRLPAAYLATLGALAFHWGGGDASLGSPLLHLLCGGTMLAAFFIVTDPVTSPSAARGLVPFAVGAAALTFIIRIYGAYPDGIAFAVLLMNGCAPLIDHIATRVRRAQ